MLEAVALGGRAVPELWAGFDAADDEAGAGDAPDDDGADDAPDDDGATLVVGTAAGVVPLAVEPASPFLVHDQLASSAVSADSSRAASAFAPVRVTEYSTLSCASIT